MTDSPEDSPERRLPARLYLGHRVVDMHRQMLREVIGSMGLSEKVVLARISPLPPIDFLSDRIEGHKPGTSIPLLGADQVIVRSIGTLDNLVELNVLTHLELPARVVWVALFWDGSPYVIPSDLDNDCHNNYGILFSPDLPPVAINEEYLEEMSDANPSTSPSTLDVHRVKSRFGEQVLHWLSDQDCLSLIYSLEQAALKDIDYQFVQSTIRDFMRE